MQHSYLRIHADEKSSRRADFRRRSADAAKATAAVAAEEFRFTRLVLERPYLGFETISQTNFRDGLRPTFTVTFRNAGRTSALRVLSNVSFAIRDDTLERPRPYDESSTRELPLIPADEVMTRVTTLNTPLAQGAILRLLNRERRFYVYGFVEYEDGAGTRFDRNEFCRVLNEGPGRPREIVGSFDPCPEPTENAGQPPPRVKSAPAPQHRPVPAIVTDEGQNSPPPTSDTTGGFNRSTQQWPLIRAGVEIEAG